MAFDPLRMSITTWSDESDASDTYNLRNTNPARTYENASYPYPTSKSGPDAGNLSWFTIPPDAQIRWKVKWSSMSVNMCYIFSTQHYPPCYLSSTIFLIINLNRGRFDIKMAVLYKMKGMYILNRTVYLQRGNNLS